MERSWTYKVWKPTMVPIKVDLGWNLPEKKKVQEIRDLLILRAKDVADRSYFPLAWVGRGDMLFKLGYPDLAAGDAYKAIRLCDAGLCYISKLGTKVRLDIGMWLMLQNPEASCWAGTVLAQEAQEHVAGCLKDYRKKAYKYLLAALYAAQDNRAAMEICQKAQALYPYDNAFAQSLRDITERIRSKEYSLERFGHPRAEIEAEIGVGCIRMRQYPWVSGELLRRGPDLISKSNLALKPYSNCIQIKASSIGDSENTPDNQKEAKCLGYFATRNIREGELILKAPSALGVCNRQTTTHCYNCSEALKSSRTFGFPCCPNMRFCSSGCQNISEKSYHKTLCGHDFSDIYKDAEAATNVHNPAVYSLFWIRLLACCVQEGGHPLEMLWMARLLAQYKLDANVAWSLRANVVAPLQILESFGIDIFADARYDCWVLETMWHRVKNNCSHYSKSGVHCFNLNEHYALFNHSCRLPPTIGAQNATLTAGWVALCPIRKGQEVFTTYLGGATEAPREVRQKMLMPWLAQKCGCAICKSGSL